MGYAWRSKEYLVAARDVIFQRRTVRRRADKEAFDVKLTDAVVVRYEDFILKGAKTTIQIRMPTKRWGRCPLRRTRERIRSRPETRLLDPEGFVLNMATLRDARAAHSHKQGLDQSVTTAKLAD